MKNIRTLAILLLDDENGIPEAAFNELADFLVESDNTDILDVAVCVDGRVFINEGDAEKLAQIGPVTAPDLGADNRYFPTETPLGEQIDGGGEIE